MSIEVDPIVQYVIAGCSTVGLLLVFFAWREVRATRKERLESVWDFLCQSSSDQIKHLRGKEKVAEITCINARRDLRRNRHLYLERIAEALRIEKPGWYAWYDLKKRYKRVQEWYWRALNVYGDDIEAFEDVKIWHDYSSGNLDPVASDLRILRFLANGEKGEESIVQQVVGDIFKELRVEAQNDAQKEAERRLRRRLQDLEDRGFLKMRRDEFTCDNYWELSRQAKEVIGWQKQMMPD